MRIVLGAALLAVLTACGSSDAPDDKKADAVNKPAACTELLADLTDSVQELDSRFRTGLDMDEFDDRVGDVQVQVDKVAGQEAEEIAPECGDAYSALAGVTDIAKDVKRRWEACLSAAKFMELVTCDSSTDYAEIDSSDGAVFSTPLSRAETSISNVG